MTNPTGLLVPWMLRSGLAAGVCCAVTLSVPGWAKDEPFDSELPDDEQPVRSKEPPLMHRIEIGPEFALHDGTFVFDQTARSTNAVTRAAGSLDFKSNPSLGLRLVAGIAPSPHGRRLSTQFEGAVGWYRLNAVSEVRGDSVRAEAEVDGLDIQLGVRLAILEGALYWEALVGREDMFGRVHVQDGELSGEGANRNGAAGLRLSAGGRFPIQSDLYGGVNVGMAAGSSFHMRIFTQLVMGWETGLLP